MGNVVCIRKDDKLVGTKLLLAQPVGLVAVGLISPIFQQGPWLLVAFVACVSSLGFLSLGRRLSPEQDGLRNAEVSPRLPC